MIKGKLKNGRNLSLVIVFMSIALMCVLSGCGGNIDKDVLESNKIVNSSSVQETTKKEQNNNSNNDVSDDKNHNDEFKEDTTSDKQFSENMTSDDTVTTDDITTDDNVSSENETTIKPVETTAGPPITTQPATTQPITTKPPVTTAKPPATTQPTTTKPNVSYVIKVNTPVATGTAKTENNGYTIDYSNASSGYVMIKGASSYSGNVAVQLFKNNTENSNMLAQYKNTNSSGYVTMTLTGGSGKYIVRVIELTNGNSGKVKCTAEFQAQLSGETTPYVYPGYNVSFTSSSAAVNKAYEICAGLTSDREKTESVKQYVMKALEYDWTFAEQVGNKQITSYIPNADSILAKGKGICYDYSCLFAVMLRCQGIPVKMVHGYVANGAYHAWNEVYYDGAWHLYDTTYEDDGGSKSSSYQATKIY